MRPRGAWRPHPGAARDRDVARIVASLLAAAAAWLSAGCDDPLVEPEEIEDLRVLAARAEVLSAPERATPRPGEEVSVRVLAARPDGPAEDTTWALLACEAEETTTGLPRCRRELARASSDAAPPGPPSLTFATPGGEGVARIALVGVVCDGGTPRLSSDAEVVGCSGGVRAAPFVFRVTPAAGAEDDNDNPALADDVVRLDGGSWTAAVEDAPCASDDAGVLVAAPGTSHTIAIDLAGAAETVRAGGDEGLEVLEVAHYVTAGDLERHFTVIEGGAEPRVEVDWRAPRTHGSSAAMHFYGVVRDGRGGVSWVHRALCVR